jgi:hypothetical protein
MDISTGPPRLYADGPHPLWDRLSVSHTSRQIFADTAQRYFETRLVFFASALCLGIWLDEEVAIFAHRLLTLSQKRAVLHMSLRGDMMGWDLRQGKLDLSVLREFRGLRKITLVTHIKRIPPGLVDEMRKLLESECVHGKELEVECQT